MMDRCRAKLLAAGFREATRTRGHFYRQDTEWTAFAVNLHASGDGVKVEYGWASTAFIRMEGPDALETFGCMNINLHGQLHLPQGTDEAPFAAQVRALYDAHRGQEKDALLSYIQERRKALLTAVAVRMKPLGFRKKGSRWTRPLDAHRLLTLYVQKSAWSDAFYFNLQIDPLAPLELQPMGCCHARVLLDGMECLDWQLIGEAGMTAFLDEQLLPAVRRWMEVPADALRQEAQLGRCCIRERCAHCWAEEQGGAP